MQPRTTSSKHYPSFIRENKTLKRFSKQKRIFPRIGLNNCEEQIDKRRKIVFSGSGNRALWDIATMSMRGISSCQSWNGSHKQRLIGSMADPYCGIIYITTGLKTTKGSRMTKRAIVRFVVDRCGTPALLVERIYPDSDYVDSTPTLNIFKNFLKRKTNNKYSIITTKNFPSPLFSIPMTNAVINFNQAMRSYRDSGIEYKVNRKFTTVSKVKI